MKKISVGALIIFIKLLVFLKRLAAAFFINLVWRPVVAVLRLIFYKVVVKLYWSYLNLIKKLGWKTGGGNSLPWLISRKAVHFTAVFLTVAVAAFNFLAPDTHAVSQGTGSGTFLSELVAGEFSENEELIEEYFDEEAYISPVQQNYLDNLSAVRTQDMAGVGDELDGSDYGDGSAVVKPEIAATEKTKRQREGIVSYTVQAGDTISTIAADFDISVNTILWENDLTAYSLIRPGDELSILPVSGITHKTVKGDSLGKIAKLYNIDESKISETNKLEGDMVAIGQKLIIPGGKKVYSESAAPKALTKSYTGITAVKDLISPSDAKPVSGNKMNWPTQGYRITQYYSWGHHAVDIANKTGTPIYASDAGTIEYAGWGTGYGNQIVIDHGGGKKTRYAHLSKIYFAKGDEVSKGQAIAAMGSTGRSTGPHLHFEVIINGVKYNPLNYIK